MDDMDFDFDDMETDSMEDFWSYNDDYDEEMTDGLFSRKVENKKPDGGDGCNASKKAAPEKNCPQTQKVNPGCPPDKQPRSISCPEKSKPSCSRPGNTTEVSRAACAEKPACPKKVKRDSCVKKKKRKKPSCGNVEKRQCRKKQKLPRSGNPFIIFFLKMLQSSRKQASEVAREAGKKWCCMSRSQKKKYEQMACMERRRRCKKQQQEARKAKRKCR